MATHRAGREIGQDWIRLKNLLRDVEGQLDARGRPFIADRGAPLVLAGVDYFLPLYHETNTHPGLLPEGLLGNPEGESPVALASRAWAIVRSHLEAAEDAAAIRCGGSTPRRRETRSTCSSAC